MLKVGLTGNIAVGQVERRAGVADARGAVVIDADELARRAVEPGTPALARDRRRAGAAACSTPRGPLDRARAARIVFRDRGARAALEAIVHPAVAALRDAEYARAEARGDAAGGGRHPAALRGGDGGRVRRGRAGGRARGGAPRAPGARPRPGPRGGRRDDRGADARRAASARGADLVIENDGTLDDLAARAPPRSGRRCCERARAERRRVPCPLAAGGGCGWTCTRTPGSPSTASTPPEGVVRAARARGHRPARRHRPQRDRRRARASASADPELVLVGRGGEDARGLRPHRHPR